MSESGGNQTKYIINFIIKFISGNKKKCVKMRSQKMLRERERGRRENAAPSSEIFGIHSIIEIPD